MAAFDPLRTLTQKRICQLCGVIRCRDILQLQVQMSEVEISWAITTYKNRSENYIGIKFAYDF